MTEIRPHIIIKNGTIVNDDFMAKADVLVMRGKIAGVHADITVSKTKIKKGELYRIIDATDRYVIPGGIDPHTHMQFPFMGQIAADDFYTGTCAAVAGGTTMPILAAYEKWRKWADDKVVCDYGLSMAITTWNDGVKTSMGEVVKPDYGLNSFKFFMAYKDIFMVTDDEFYQGLKRCSELGAIARVHAENGLVIHQRQRELIELGISGPEGHVQSRPEELEIEATYRACTLAKLAFCPLYVVHVMSQGAANIIAHQRRGGSVVFGEPIAAGLGVDGSHYYDPEFDHAAGFVMSPPLSLDPTTPSVLMKFLACDQLQLTATDNCTFNRHQKRNGYCDFTTIPNGVNGAEDRMSIVWEKGVFKGRITPMRFVAITSSTAARIFNCYPQKGRIAINSDADIVIWNPNAIRTISAKTHHHAHDFNIFEGMLVHGVPEVTICGGRIVWMNGELNVTPGEGNFVKLQCNCDYIYRAIDVGKLKCHPVVPER